MDWNKKGPYPFISKGYLIVFLLWVGFEILWYFFIGIHFDLESVKYINEAKYVLQNHHFSQFRYFFYCSTIFFIGLSSLLHLGLYGALLMIMVVNFFSYLYFYKALKKIFPDSLSRLLVIVVLISFWPYQSWSLYLFTECLFYSFVLILFGYLLNYKKMTFRFLIGLGCILLFLNISRPLGILFILPSLLFVFFNLTKRQKVFFYITSFVFFVLLNIVVQIVFTSTPDWNMTRALTEDSIICDMPRSEGVGGLDLSTSSNALYQMFYYVTHNFSHFATLALVRLKYFFTMIRSYYSWPHNLYLIGYLVVLYGSILWGVRRIVRVLKLGLSVFVFTSILFFAITIALQCDDYHNRFVLTLMPFFVVLAVIAWAPLLRKISFPQDHV